MTFTSIYLALKLKQTNPEIFEPNIIHFISSFVPKKLDEIQLKNRIKGLFGNKLIKTDMDWLLRFYKYYSRQNIEHKRDDIRIGTFDDHFDMLFENSLKKLYIKTLGQKRISTENMESEFHPYIFFQTRNIDFGRGPRLRKMTIL